MTATVFFPRRSKATSLQPNAPGYDDARKVWNGMIDRRPAYIARCKSVADVQSGDSLRRENELLTAIRGGGHNAAGLGVVRRRHRHRSAAAARRRGRSARRIARAGGGATWADFDRATAAHGLATTGGVISRTGIAGLTLGGGLGWLMRSYGLTCDNSSAPKW